MDMSVETAKRCQDIYGLGARLFIGKVAWVQYRTRAEAQDALAYAQVWGVFLLSRLLRVEWARGRNYGKGRQRWYQ